MQTLCRIELCFGTLEYTLTRKNVRRINLRIKKDGKVCVSAHRRVPIAEIQAFIKSNEKFIYKAIRRAKSFSVEKPFGFTVGETVRFSGKDYKLFIAICNKESLSVQGGNIVLSVKRADSPDYIRRAFIKLLKDKCEETVLSFCKKAYPEYVKFGVEFPEIRFRAMSSRWGSCNYVKNVLTFNYALVCTDALCVEYVVYHEFTHFLIHNHSKEFYSRLSDFFPDCKKARNVISKEIIRKDYFM